MNKSSLFPLKYVCILLMYASLSSCISVRYLQGVVVDSDTQAPIDSVLVVSDRISYCEYTDSLGKFYIASIHYLGLSYRMSVSFVKEGYLVTSRRCRRNHDKPVTIMLEKRKP